MGNSFSKKKEGQTADRQTIQVSPKIYIWGNDEIEDLKKRQESIEKREDFFKTVDNIASRYIFTMDFSTMKQLHNKEYCNQLVILTKDILTRYYSEIEIHNIRQRTEKGEPILFAHKKEVNSLSNKESDCEEISKFYVKIGHLFAAIMMTISPKYEYIDPASGEKIMKTINEKKNIPENVNVTQYNNGLCHEKINILLGNLNTDIKTKKEDLSQEVGIPELMNLYYDSEYDFQTGSFHGMTTKTRKKFEKDLEDFYKAFTQEKEMPSHITKFSDIKINNYYNIFAEKKNLVALFFSRNEDDESEKEEEEEEDFEIEMDSKKIPLYNYFIRQYANNLKSMMKNVNHRQKQLLKILNHIFVESEKEEYRIRPTLTVRTLNDYIEETRNIIVDMYIQCEDHFLKGVQIYEAIVEKILLHTTRNQIDTLNIIMENIYSPQDGLFSIPNINALVESSV